MAENKANWNCDNDSFKYFNYDFRESFVIENVRFWTSESEWNISIEAAIGIMRIACADL